jgi:polysaccharide export outer membrane protein
MNPSTRIASTPAVVESTDLLRVGGTAREASTSVGHFGANLRDEDYVIGPEDVLAINVWHETELSRSVPVRLDGKISLPLVGDLKASGLTPRELEAELAKGLDAYIHKPQVTVIVQEVNSHKFYVLGEVQRPGSYPLSPKMTLLSALAIAGGFRDFAKVNQIYLLRPSPDGTRSHIRFDYKAAVKGSNSYRDLELKAGDTVVVP